MVIEVPAGEKVPAVFYETDPKPAPQQKMLDRIAAEFNETVTNPPPGVPEQEIWEDARRRADEQYLKLYGHAAYNARHLQSAREAVREKRALEAAAQQVDAAGSGSGAP
jgi:DNA-binding transcriptional MocR family regulator